MEFLRAVVEVRRDDVAVIETAIREHCDSDIEGLEKLWIQYCKKRQDHCPFGQPAPAVPIDAMMIEPARDRG